MAVGQAQSAYELFSSGQINKKSDKLGALKINQQQFGETLKVFSKPDSDHSINNAQQRRQAKNNPAFGNKQPLGGNDLPSWKGIRSNRFDAQVSSTSIEKSASKNDVDSHTGPQTKNELIADLKRRGVDPEELKDLVVSKGEMTEEEFDELMDSPEDFLTQLNDWLQSDLLSQDILALTTQPVALQQFALLGRASNGGRVVGSDMQGAASLLDVQPKKDQASDIVGRLLDEKGGEESLEEGLSKDKLFEQMLNSKSSDASGKSGVFAGLLGESVSGNLSSLQSTGQGLAGIGANIPALSSASTASGAIPQLPMLRGLPGQPGATEALSERIMMMRTKNLQVAEIKLDPQELGALEVRVKIVNDVASVQFHSPNPGVREALESQIVKLREMMDGAGLNLGDVDVSEQSLSDAPEETFAGQNSENSSSVIDSDNGDVESIDGTTIMTQTKQSIGLVDYFA